MKNHITLVLYYIKELREIELAQRWINAAREVNRNQYVQLQLDRYQTDLIVKKVKLQDEMLEISRNN
jgi:hypothetical protein